MAVKIAFFIMKVPDSNSQSWTKYSNFVHTELTELLQATIKNAFFYSM